MHGRKTQFSCYCSASVSNYANKYMKMCGLLHWITIVRDSTIIDSSISTITQFNYGCWYSCSLRCLMNRKVGVKRNKQIRYRIWIINQCTSKIQNYLSQEFSDYVALQHIIIFDLFIFSSLRAIFHVNTTSTYRHKYLG